jgi:hypothetical protein
MTPVYLRLLIVLLMSRVVRLLLPLATVALMASCGSRITTSPAPSATLTNGAVQLEWNPAPEQNVTGYRVYYGTASRTYQQPLGQGLTSTATTYTLTGLAGAHRYFFAVTASNSLGMESGYSNEVVLDIP